MGGAGGLGGVGAGVGGGLVGGGVLWCVGVFVGSGWRWWGGGGGVGLGGWVGFGGQPDATPSPSQQEVTHLLGDGSGGGEREHSRS